MVLYYGGLPWWLRQSGSEPWQVKGKQAETAASRLRVRLKEELSRRMLDIKAV